MKLKVLDTKGKTVEDITLNKDVFDAETNDKILRQYLRVYQMNQRQGTSSTKTRSEISGGGRKPWPQKGTGRARHGSIRSPIWRTGGISHGPKPKNWSLNLPKKMKKNAIISALSYAASKGKPIIVDKIDIRKPKTKKFVEIIEKLKLGGKILLVLDEKNENVYKSARNIEKVKVSLVDNLNAYDLLNADYIVILKKAVEKLQEKYGEK